MQQQQPWMQGLTSARTWYEQPVDALMEIAG